MTSKVEILKVESVEKGKNAQISSNKAVFHIQN